MNEQRTYTAFLDQRCIASGRLIDVGLEMKKLLAAGEQGVVAIFDDETGRLVDLDFRGTDEQFVSRIRSQHGSEPRAEAPAKRTGPGRPKLGVVGREVTLLPRHWEWLNAQPGGASVTLRKLVEKARREGQYAERAQRLRDGTYRFMSFMAGNLPGFEEASRSLYAKDYARLEGLIHEWPTDVRNHLLRLVRDLERAEQVAAAHAAKGRPAD